MVQEKNSTDTPKKKRGRPRKDLKDSVKAIEESIQKKQNLPQIENLKNAGVSNLSIVNQFPKTEDEIKTWQTDLSNEIKRLDKQLELVDKEYFAAKKKLKKIELERRKQVKLRDQLNSKIRSEENKIFNAEKTLQEIKNNFYSADIPDFLRSFLKFFPFYKDEILLRTSIAQNEAKIEQRKKKSVAMNRDLAKTILAFKSYQTSTQIIETMSESYRIARKNLGKIQRDFNLSYQASITESEQTDIVSAYNQTIENLNSVKQQFEDSALETKQQTEDSYNEIISQSNILSNILNDQ